MAITVICNICGKPTDGINNKCDQCLVNHRLEIFVAEKFNSVQQRGLKDGGEEALLCGFAMAYLYDVLQEIRKLNQDLTEKRQMEKTNADK